jgi:hypothetical protein
VGGTTTAPVIINWPGCGWGAFDCTRFWGSTQTEASIEMVQYTGRPVIYMQYPLAPSNRFVAMFEAAQCSKWYLAISLGTSSLPGNPYDQRHWASSSGAHLDLMSVLVPDGDIGMSCATSTTTAYKITAMALTSTPMYVASYNAANLSLYSQSGNQAIVNALFNCTNLSTCQTYDAANTASPGFWLAGWATQMAGISMRFEIGGNSTGTIGYDAALCPTPDNPTTCDGTVVTPINEIPVLGTINQGYLMWNGPGKHVSTLGAGFGDQVETCAQNSAQPCVAVDALNFLTGVPTTGQSSSSGNSGGIF